VTQSGLRFCPFCREAFEDEMRCPSHDVELVSLRELGALAAANVPDDSALALCSPKRGRGPLALGAALTLLGFFCSFGTMTGPLEATNTLFALARGRTLHLWIVPLAALALCSVLYRRRTGPALRGARLAVLFVALLPSAVVLFTWLSVRRAALLLSARTHESAQFTLGLGAWLVWLACLPLLWGAARLGVSAKARLR
jgi:hypothetical protein